MNKLKTNSTNPIPILQDLGTGRWYFHFNHESYEGEDQLMYRADTILFESFPDVSEIETAIGRELTDEELRIYNEQL